MGMDREEGACCPEINKEKDEGAEHLYFRAFIIACADCYVQKNSFENLSRLSDKIKIQP